MTARTTPKPPLLWFFCLEPGCDTHGTTTAGEASAAMKHQQATRHAVMVTRECWGAAVSES